MAGAAVYMTGSVSARDKALLLGVASLGSIAPDLDFVPGILIGNMRAFHHGMSHSLVFAGLFATIVFLALRNVSSTVASRGAVLAAVSYALHVLMDLISVNNGARGVPLLWPLSSAEIGFTSGLFGHFRYGDLSEGLWSVLRWTNLDPLLREIGVLGTLMLAIAQKERLRGRRLPTFALCVMVGVASGILFQKFYGAGRLLTQLGLRSSAASMRGLSADPLVAANRLPDDFFGTLSLFILGGQSNMSGRGDLPSEQRSAANVFTFGNDYRWKRALEPVDDPTGQVDGVSEDGPADPAGFGPALSFARALAAERPQMRIGLIPCAKGDSSIHDWRRSLSDGTLYGSCLKRVRAASPAGTLSGLLFFQGESDALTPEQNPGRVLSPATYSTLFTEVVNGLRNDLSSPSLPMVFAQIGSQRVPLAFANWERVRQQQAAVHLPCSRMISTADLPLRDGVHFTTRSYETIGQRFANAYLSVMQEQRCRV